MREAELMLAPSPADLAAQPVRQPDVRPPVAQERLDDCLGAAGLGHEGGAVAVMEHPEPPIGLTHAHPGFVGRQRRPRQQTLLDQVRLGGEGLARGREDVDQRAFADVEVEQVFQHVAEPRHRDALHRAQIDHERAKVRPERRSRLQALGRRRLEASGATRAVTALQRHARHVGLDLWNFDPVVDLNRALRHVRDIRAAILADMSRNDPLARRIRVERAMRPGVRIGLGPGLGRL
jgi:hypothetical protein